jgi:hypothetical protein
MVTDRLTDGYGKANKANNVFFEIISCKTLHKANTTEKIAAFQYSETNVMHILFNLLRIKDLYLFRALLSHP